MRAVHARATIAVRLTRCPATRRDRPTRTTSIDEGVAQVKAECAASLGHQVHDFDLVFRGRKLQTSEQLGQVGAHDTVSLVGKGALLGGMKKTGSS